MNGLSCKRISAKCGQDAYRFVLLKMCKKCRFRSLQSTESVSYNTFMKGRTRGKNNERIDGFRRSAVSLMAEMLYYDF